MLIIGIAGGTGSGKTTFVNQIIKDLPTGEVCVISQDSYYKATENLTYEERKKINFDHPAAIDFGLIVQQLEILKSGEKIEQPLYSFVTHNRIKDTLEKRPSKVVIIEGILIFNNKALRDLIDIKIFINAATDERLIRRIRRDTSERGRDIDEVLSRYQNTLKPMHRDFIAPSKKFADIIIPNDKYNTVAIDIVKTVINERL
ncbi:uridine kinase [Polaribacter sp.]|nr:uridine kinase [Polaribacter sp.]